MPTSNEIRKAFLDYFLERGHAYAPSAPLPAVGDPTLLFVNSGMVQFKDVFLGHQTPSHTRVCNSQKCLRVSGKHNDLEEVGRDGTHHTFFEMLGYWSFGDYFKREAISWVWELLTGVWGLPKDRLYATVFGGDDSDGLPRDDEAAELWSSVTDIDPSHIRFFGKKDNFWEMGETGPCGPDSEIHLDLTPDGSGAHLVNADDPAVVELGNNVFIQYNRGRDGALTPLPRKHVDFGGGFERFVAVLQGKRSNYDTDLFSPIIEATRDVAGSRGYEGRWDDPVDTAYRVVADHVRCLTFAITDGVLPSNEGAGYVLRRILRRAARHGRQSLGVTEPFIHRLVPVVVELMADAFPELASNAQRVAETIREEEAGFERTLGRGIELFEQAASRVVAAAGRQIPAPDAFKLHDTYGFPLDLTEVMAEERGMTVDVEGFAALMEQARDLARAAAGGTSTGAALAELAQREAIADTEFCGFDACALSLDAVPIVFALSGDTYRRVEAAHPGDEVAVALPKTPFYAEAGGQVGDRGVITSADVRLVVGDTQRAGGVHFHIGVVESGQLLDGVAAAWSLEVDRERRDRILANHTGTHLMNLALRHVLGRHVDQKGSLVDDEKLRFDLSHPKPVGPEELEAIENEVNADIRKNLPVHDRVVPLDSARGVRNLRAVFGEKYPAEVRVVSIGATVAELLERPDDERWDAYSIELCGGTHLAKTGEAIAFTLVSEEAVAKGVRRVTAFTGRRAVDTIARGADLLRRTAALDASDPAALAASVTELSELLASEEAPAVVKARVRELLGEHQRVIREGERVRGRAAASELAAQLKGRDPSALALIVAAPDAKTLRAAVEETAGASPLLVVSDTDGSIVAVVPESLRASLPAEEWVRQTAAAYGGRGGGRSDVAQGRVDPSRAGDACTFAERYGRDRLG